MSYISLFLQLDVSNDTQKHVKSDKFQMTFWRVLRDFDRFWQKWVSSFLLRSIDFGVGWVLPYPEALKLVDFGHFEGSGRGQNDRFWEGFGRVTHRRYFIEIGHILELSYFYHQNVSEVIQTHQIEGSKTGQKSIILRVPGGSWEGSGRVKIDGFEGPGRVKLRGFERSVRVMISIICLFLCLWHWSWDWSWDEGHRFGQEMTKFDMFLTCFGCQFEGFWEVSEDNYTDIWPFSVSRPWEWLWDMGSGHTNDPKTCKIDHFLMVLGGTFERICIDRWGMSSITMAFSCVWDMEMRIGHGDEDTQMVENT